MPLKMGGWGRKKRLLKSLYNDQLNAQIFPTAHPSTTLGEARQFILLRGWVERSRLGAPGTVGGGEVKLKSLQGMMNSPHPTLQPLSPDKLLEG